MEHSKVGAQEENSEICHLD